MLGLQTTTLGRYYLHSQLARGGMSEVYLAYDIENRCRVAIKVVESSQVEHSRRLQREITALCKLAHPHILPTLDYGIAGQWHYLVMPYIEQGTLRERIAKAPLKQEEAGLLLEQIASALQFAHNHHIIHRDIKPSNILLLHGQHAYLADFGLAKPLEDRKDEITQTGCLIGTPEYMAPELADQPAGISSDIYALGILLYQMITGRVPFSGSTPLAIYWKHMQEQPVRPSQLNPLVSRHIEQVVLVALEKDPHRRFRSAQALVDAYKQALAHAHRPGFLTSALVVLSSTKAFVSRLTPSLRECEKE